ncbi:hypothetical protein PybrP1_007974 [[Pythium] brassicae (nom. inval.)]|nr:hypothetical protein PybrP1_007974 [[Pythium] brassicae (nom. inval.)]
MGIVDDALVGGGGGAGEMELPGEFDAFPSRDECTAVLTMKCGDPLKAVRKKLHDEVPFTFVPDEGFGVFLSKVERHYSKLDKAFVQEQRGVYLKPSSNATQVKYVLLTEENFDPLLRMRWKIARSMKVELKYEVFSYFVDASSKKEKKRLSMKMFQPESSSAHPPHPVELHNAAAAAAAVGFGHAGGGVGGFALPPAVVSHGLQAYAEIGASIGGSLSGRGPAAKSAAALLGNSRDDSSERPRKAARSSQRASATAAADDEPFFQAIPVRINGFVVPLEVDVAALRRCLGLAPLPPSLSSSSTGGGGVADTELDA